MLAASTVSAAAVPATGRRSRKFTFSTSRQGSMAGRFIGRLFLIAGSAGLLGMRAWRAGAATFLFGAFAQAAIRHTIRQRPKPPASDGAALCHAPAKNIRDEAISCAGARLVATVRRWAMLLQEDAQRLLIAMRLCAERHARPTLPHHHFEEKAPRSAKQRFPSAPPEIGRPRHFESLRPLYS